MVKPLNFVQPHATSAVISFSPNTWQIEIMRSNYIINNRKKFEKSDSIKAIIFCEFDVNLGPIIKYQYPEDYVTKETFESLSVYLIPKSELHGKLITITACGLKILGYPVSITNSKYKRNQLIFNVCFVFSDISHTAQYEPIIQKLAHYFIDLECEMEFIWKGKYSVLPQYFCTIKEQLTDKGICIINVSQSTVINLKLTKVKSEPEQVKDYHVPVITCPDFFNKNNTALWDLTTQQIYNFINGYNHISKIACEADVDLNLVKACIQNLIYYDLVKLIPIFQYSNVYVTTPKISLLIENSTLQKECLSYVHRSDSPNSPTIRQVLQLYSNMCPGMTVKDLCQRFNPNYNGIDEQKLIKFGLMNGIIRRIQKYPILLSQNVNDKKFLMYFDGNNSYDQICCETHKTYQELEDCVERDPNIFVCWK